jgi:hypothetical protein
LAKWVAEEKAIVKGEQKQEEEKQNLMKSFRFRVYPSRIKTI